MFVVKELSFSCNWMLFKEHLSQKTHRLYLLVSIQVKQQNNIRYKSGKKKSSDHPGEKVNSTMSI